jgi:hypothetical protein
VLRKCVRYYYLFGTNLGMLGDILNKFLIASALSIALFCTTGANALDRRVQINNQSSYDIVQFYASNTGSKSWEEDILGKSVLPAGTSVMINIDDGSGFCKYDFLAVFEDGDEVTSTDNNVCELSQFNFTD